MASVAAAAVVAPADCCLPARGSTGITSSASPSGRIGGAALPCPPLHGHGIAKSFAARRRQSMRSTSSRPRSLIVRAAKLPAGVEAPLEEPKLQVSLWGFTEKAEVWNSRAAMIGLFALIALEFFAHRGILQMIGVDVGKGLNIPL